MISFQRYPEWKAKLLKLDNVLILQKTTGTYFNILSLVLSMGYLAQIHVKYIQDVKTLECKQPVCVRHSSLPVG